MNAKINDAAKSEIMFLLNTAMVRLNDDEPENMAWRLADAGGLLREAMPRKDGEDLIGRDEPTGRGYVLPTKERGPANPVFLIEALERLVLAADRRDYTTGDQINLISVKAELASAAEQARAAIAKAKGE